MESIDDLLDQMVDTLLVHDEIGFIDLLQFIWRRGWPLDSASRPTDHSQLRLALKACIIERMVEIWTAPPKNCKEKTPTWCAEIPPLKERFNIITPDEQVFWKDEPSNDIFEKRNIFAPKEFMFFL